MIDRFAGRYEFLSNFHPSPIRGSDGILYPTAEHYFQAHKSLLRTDRLTVAGAPTPNRAKYLGRAATLRPDWEVVKIGVMRNGLALKFAPNSPLGQAHRHRRRASPRGQLLG